MKKLFTLIGVLLIFAVGTFMAGPADVFAAAKVSATEYSAGDTVTIEGAINPGQDLYVAVAQQKMFASKDTAGVHETKRLKKDMGSPPVIYGAILSHRPLYPKCCLKSWALPMSTLFSLAPC